MTLNHENLKVYQRTLAFNARIVRCVAEWDSKHVICDHLPRAAESVLDNIAAASAAYSMMKVRNLNYAIGSTLECAACLDLAGIKGLLDVPSISLEKREASEILMMLIGLRRSWSAGMAREDHAEYEVDDHPKKGVTARKDAKVLFHHEKLDVYRLALQTAEVFSSSGAVHTLSVSAFRKLDVPLTSMVLNIAEGNGRFSDADQRRFLTTSHEAAGKMAAKLDLHVVQGLLASDYVNDLKALLSRVSAMVSAMIRSCGDEGKRQR